MNDDLINHLNSEYVELGFLLRLATDNQDYLKSRVYMLKTKLARMLDEVEAYEATLKNHQP